MAMYANGNESPTLRTYVSDETKVSFLNVSTFKSAQVPWTYFFLSNGRRLVADKNKTIFLHYTHEGLNFLTDVFFCFSSSGGRIGRRDDIETRSDCESDFYLDDEEFPELGKPVRH